MGVCCFGKLSVVTVAPKMQRLVREIHRGTRVGLYNLTAWSAAIMTDVEITPAHAVVSIAQLI